MYKRQVSDRETLNVLVENDMVEDLTEVYANCTSPRIKAMYNSYGPQPVSYTHLDVYKRQVL